MNKLEKFDSCLPSGISYGGHGGSKKGIIFNNERWFLKYPKTTKSMNVENISYSTTPLSEYLGSKIYESLGFETHEVKLGIANEKVVVACKDFLNTSEVILDYNAIKNEYDENIEKTLEEISSKSSGINQNNNIEEIMVIMDNNIYFNKIKELKERFWDMFIVDAFISNNDRNEANWGVILDKNTRDIRICPIFDNGASFYNKSSDDRLEDICNNDIKFKQSVYDSSISIYRENNKIINPLKYIESMKNEECNKALLRIVPRIDFNKITNIFNELSNLNNEYTIISESQKNFYLKSLKYKYDKVLLPIYKKLSGNI